MINTINQPHGNQQESQGGLCIWNPVLPVTAANQDTMEFKRPCIGLGGGSGEESLDNTGISQKDVRKTTTPV